MCGASPDGVGGVGSVLCAHQSSHRTNDYIHTIPNNQTEVSMYVWYANYDVIYLVHEKPVGAYRGDSKIQHYLYNNTSK